MDQEPEKTGIPESTCTPTIPECKDRPNPQQCSFHPIIARRELSSDVWHFWDDGEECLWGWATKHHLTTAAIGTQRAYSRLVAYYLNEQALEEGPIASMCCSTYEPVDLGSHGTCSALRSLPGTNPLTSLLHTHLQNESEKMVWITLGDSIVSAGWGSWC